MAKRSEFAKRTLRIAIDCGVDDPRQGTATAVLSLAHAFSESAAPDQEYTFIISEKLVDWLKPYVFGPSRLVGRPDSVASRLKRILPRAAPLRAIWKNVRPKGGVGRSNGYVESMGFDLVHFPGQTGYLTRLPTIYQPWDLQHLHYPRFFSKGDFSIREVRYRAFCQQAKSICVQTEWCKKDIAAKYEINPNKIDVIRWGCILDSYAPPTPSEVTATVERFRLPTQFFFYPAVTWQHKNHEVILLALKELLRVHGRQASVYFTGAPGGNQKNLEEMVRQLGLTHQVHFLGFVSEKDLQAIYASATAMIFASKFEGFGLPILEAFKAGLPVISTNSTSLPEVAMDAALYFDPDSPEQVANLMLTMLDSQDVRQCCAIKGASVLAQSSMRETAARFRDLYRCVASKQNTSANSQLANTRGTA